MKSLSPNKLASSNASAPSGTTLPTANDGQALIRENGEWVAGPVIGGVNYTPANADTNYSDVYALFNFNGADGSTTLTDASSFTVTATAYGNAALSTTQSKFGGASLSIPGTSDYVRVTHDSNAIPYWAHPNREDFTFEAWVYPTDQSGTTERVIFRNANYFRVTTFGGQLVFWGGSDVTNSGLYLTDNQWNHIAIVGEATANDVWFYVNGVKSSVHTDYDGGDTPTATSYIGHSNFIGYIDSVRWTQGVSRYTANFTPPTAEFVEQGSSPVVIPYSIDKLDDVDTSTAAPTDGQALLWDAANSKWEPGSTAAGTSIENNRVETFTYEVNYYGGSTTNPAAPGDATVRTGTTWLIRFHEQDKNGKNLLLTSEYSGPSSITIKRNGSDVDYPISTYGLIKQGNYFQFGTTNQAFALGDTFEFTFTRPAEGDFAALKADLTSYETVNGDVVRDIKSNDRLLTAASTAGHVYDSFQSGSPGSPTADGHYAIRYAGSGNPIIRVWPNDTNGNAFDLHTVSYTGATGTNQKPFFYAWANGILYKIPISSQIYSQSGYYQWYCAGAATELQALQNAGSIRIVHPWEAYEEPQDGDVLAYDSTNKTYHPAGIRALLGIGEYADDTAAGTGGVASGAMYYNTTSSDYRLKS